MLLHNVDIKGQCFPEEFKGITSLTLIRCKFDIEAITELKELRTLRITDITAEEAQKLSALTNMESIMIMGSESSSFGKKMNEVDCEITDLGFMKDWKDLRRAELYGCEKLNDISALEDKKNISVLRIKNCAVTDEQIAAVKAVLPKVAAHEERMERARNEHKGISADI